MMEGVKTFKEVGREKRGGIQGTNPHLTDLTPCSPHPQFPAPGKHGDPVLAELPLLGPHHSGIVQNRSWAFTRQAFHRIILVF